MKYLHWDTFFCKSIIKITAITWQIINQSILFLANNYPWLIIFSITIFRLSSFIIIIHEPVYILQSCLAISHIFQFYKVCLITSQTSFLILTCMYLRLIVNVIFDYRPTLVRYLTLCYRRKKCGGISKKYISHNY